MAYNLLLLTDKAVASFSPLAREDTAAIEEAGRARAAMKRVKEEDIIAISRRVTAGDVMATMPRTKVQTMNKMDETRLEARRTSTSVMGGHRVVATRPILTISPHP